MMPTGIVDVEEPQQGNSAGFWDSYTNTTCVKKHSLIIGMAIYLQLISFCITENQ